MNFAVLVFGSLAILAWFALLGWLFDRYPLVALALLGIWVWLMLGSDFSGSY